MTTTNKIGNLKSSYATRRPHQRSEKEIQLVTLEIRGVSRFGGGTVRDMEIERLKRQATHPTASIRDYAISRLKEMGVDA